MEWLALAFIVYVAKQIIGGFVAGIQQQAARQSEREVEAALETAHEVQEDRIKDEYEATQRQIEEKAVEITGAQTAALSAMGQAGGEGTAAAGLILQTEALRTRDQSLLDQSYENAQADLDAQHELAQSQLDADFRAQEAAIASNFIASNLNALTDFAVGAMGIRGPGTILGGAAAGVPEVSSGPPTPPLMFQTPSGAAPIIYNPFRPRPGGLLPQ